MVGTGFVPGNYAPMMFLHRRQDILVQGAGCGVFGLGCSADGILIWYQGERQPWAGGGGP